MCTIVLFGATGDLARRKLFPALYNLYLDQLLPENFGVVGIGRRLESREEFIASVTQAIRSFSRQTQADRCTEFLKHLDYLQMDINSSQSFSYLRERLPQGNILYYLSVPPEQFDPIIEELLRAGLTSSRTAWRRVIIEKPFGSDLASARQLNDKIRSAFSEADIFRIDHYLGKGMLQNIQVIRFANSVFENLWNYRYIDHVQIRASETVGVEDRGAYYDQTGALRDMVQNHLLQALTLVAMEPPINLSAEAVRDEKVKVLRSLVPFSAEEVRENVVRGQYGPGVINGQRVRGYREEENVAADSHTETFTALKVYVNNFRWAQVPFYLRTGKRMAGQSVEIVIQFKNLPGVLYFDQPNNLQPNILAIKVQPEEGLVFQFNGINLDSQEEIVPVKMDFCHNCAGGSRGPEAYERLLYDAINGDSTLFTRWDEVEHSWRFIDAIADAWRQAGTEPLIYPAGSWGPRAADLLLERDGRRWCLV